MKKEASYTVEIALLMPVLFLALLLPVYTGFRLYERTKEISASVSEERVSMEKQIRNLRFQEDFKGI